LSKLSGAKFDASVANFGIYSKKVIQAINKMDEPIRFFPAMVKWVGFKSTAISINHSERAEGKSSYSFRKLCNLGLDIVLAYSDLPLRIVAGVGLLLSFCSVILTLLVVERALTKGFSVVGYASLVCLILFYTGLIVFILGMVGLYIGKIFEATKNRPIYVEEERVNF
jgi:dolichol-phosphate mannosyltransferase